MSLLTEFKDIFAWSYEKILELDPKVAVHAIISQSNHGIDRLSKLKDVFG